MAPPASASPASRLLRRVLRRASLAAGLWLAVSLALAPGVAAACTYTQQGSIVLPTGTEIFRPWSLISSGHTVFYYRITDIHVATDFELEAVVTTQNVAGVENPDFDIVFFSGCSGGFGGVTGEFSTTGDESGKVPNGSSCALVYMRIGPGTAVPNGNRFEYRDDC